MKRLLLILAILAAPALASAQCSGGSCRPGVSAAKRVVTAPVRLLKARPLRALFGRRCG